MLTILLRLPILAPIAVLFSGTARAQCAPDVFEVNDTCAQAVPLAAGTYGGLTLAGLNEQDYYSVSANAGELIQVTVTLTGGTVLSAFLFRDDGSPLPCDDDANTVAGVDAFGGEPTATMSWSTGAAPGNFWVQVIRLGDECVTYDLSIATVADPCAALVDLAFEDNDTCATAVPISVGSHPGLRAWVADRDYYSIQAAPGELLTVEYSADTPADILTGRAWLGGGTCDVSQAVSSTIGFGGGSLLYLFNDSPTVRDYVFEIGLNNALCAGYSLLITGTNDPCGQATGDALEPNDACSAAAPLTATQGGLGIDVFERDWYEVTVPGNSTLVLGIEAADPVLLTMTLYSTCGLGFLALGRPDGPLRQRLEWTNQSSLPVSTLLDVGQLGLEGLFCTHYDLELEIQIGGPFCPTSPNSSGGPALLFADGSTTLGAGTLTLRATTVPSGVFGVFFFGLDMSGATTFGNGFLCVAAPLFRLPITTTSAGHMTVSVDLGVNGPLGALVPGDSAWFQGFFRDTAAGGAGFDLTGGRRVTFQ